MAQRVAACKQEKVSSFPLFLLWKTLLSLSLLTVLIETPQVITIKSFETFINLQKIIHIKMSIVHCSHVFTHNNEPITCVRALPDGVIVVGGESGYLYVYSVDSFTMLNRVKAHDNHVFSILYVRNGENMLVSVGGDGNVKVWTFASDFSSFQCVKVLRSTRNCGDV